MNNDPTTIHYVSPLDVINLPLYEYHFVIDTRSPAKYDAHHIATALAFHTQSEGDKHSCARDRVKTRNMSNVHLESLDLEKELLAFISYVVENDLQPELYSPILIYGDDDSAAQTEWLAARMLEAPQRGLAIHLDPRATDEDHVDLMQTLWRRIANPMATSTPNSVRSSPSLSRSVLKNSLSAGL